MRHHRLLSALMGLVVGASLFAPLQVRAATADVITTVAGGGPSGMPDVNANLNQPYDVAIDAAGNIYFASAQQNRVYKIDTKGKLTLIAGTGVAGYSGDGGSPLNAQLNHPLGVAVDNANPVNIYISDYDNCLVRKISGSNGTIITIAGLVNTPADRAPYPSCGYSGDGGQAKAAELDGPETIAIDPRNDDLYIADYYNGRVRKVAGGVSTGAITTIAGGGSSTTSANNCAGGAPYGDGSSAAAAYLCYPQGVALDTSVSPANVFISENYRCTVREVVGATKDIYTVAGITNSCGYLDGVAATSGRLNSPWQLHTAVSGATTTVTVADYANGRIRSFPITYKSNVPTAGTLTTIAGEGRGFCGDGGAALSSCMGPVGIAFDATGNYYIGDYDNSRIRKVTKSTGLIGTIAGWGNSNYSDPVNLGSVPATGLSLYYPAGVFADPHSTTVYIGGYSSYSVYAFDSVSGTATTVAGNGVAGYAGDGTAAASATTELNLPEGITKDASGNVYIADIDNCAVREVNTSGDITTIAGGSPGHLNGCGYTGDGGLATDAQLNTPRGLAYYNHSLYVAEYGSCVVRKIVLSSGAISTVAGNGTCGFLGDGGPAKSAQLNRPAAISFDAIGDMFIADTSNQRIREVDGYFGYIMTVAGDGDAGFTGEGDAVGVALNGPSGVASDVNGNLFIADQSNHLVRWLEPGGQLINIAGTPQTAGFTGDGGAATAAELNNPVEVAVDTVDNVYISDYYNNRIRKVSAFPGFGRSTDRIIFPKQHIGTPSGYQTITLSAIGSTTISSISVPSGFSEIDDCAGVTLAATQTCEIDVSFTPAKAGITDGMLSIGSNSLFPEQPKTIELVGEGGGLTLSGTATFANQLDGASTTNTMTLTNTGATAVLLSTVVFENTASFKVTGGTCKAGTSLAAAASCTILATFTPTNWGTHNGTLAVVSNDPASPLLTPFIGESTILTPTPTSLAFGTVVDGKPKVLNVTVKNTQGPYTLKPAVSGAGYSILSTGNTCAGVALASAATCTLPIQFAPTDVGSYAGTLTLVSGVSASPVVTLTGTGSK